MFTVCSDLVGCVTLHGQAIHLSRDTDLWQGSPARDTSTLWMFSWFPSTFIPNAFYSTALFITCGWELSSNSLFTAASHYAELNTWTTLEIICFSGEHVPLFRGWILNTTLHARIYIHCPVEESALLPHPHSLLNYITFPVIPRVQMYFPVWQECWKCKLGKLNDVRDCFWKAKTYWELKCVLGI